MDPGGSDDPTMDREDGGAVGADCDEIHEDDVVSEGSLEQDKSDTAVELYDNCAAGLDTRATIEAKQHCEPPVENEDCSQHEMQEAEVDQQEEPVEPATSEHCVQECKHTEKNINKRKLNQRRKSAPGVLKCHSRACPVCRPTRKQLKSKTEGKNEARSKRSKDKTTSNVREAWPESIPHDCDVIHVASSPPLSPNNRPQSTQSHDSGIGV
uniref:Uncharacterized protein n=1 Tax=Ciona savignyi TaxID=51511 RepID=H2YFU3_CIOSA